MFYWDNKFIKDNFKDITYFLNIQLKYWYSATTIADCYFCFVLNFKSCFLPNRICLSLPLNF
jgi:hypothetical protein